MQARYLIEKNIYDLLILDIELPDGDGRSLCYDFRQISEAPVLFLSGKSETEDKIIGFNTGGDYYLTKPYNRDEFVAVILSLLRRSEQMKKMINDTYVISKGSLVLNLKERKAFVKKRDVELTLKEFAVLLMLVQNEDTELSNEQIYKNVWGTTMNNDANAVRLQISRLKKKLGETESSDFNIFTEYGKGYTFTTK
jgi:DNA-binding response OmpR family regulator